MTLPYPPHTALLGDTDLAIKTLAYATDAKLAGYTQMYVTTGTGVTDINGEIVVDFHTSATLIGAIVQPAGFVRSYGQVKQFPPGQGTATDMSPTLVALHVRQFRTDAGGLVWVKVMLQPLYWASGRWYGSQPAAAGTSVPYVAFGWA